jgi:hypothetical protein
MAVASGECELSEKVAFGERGATAVEVCSWP